MARACSMRAHEVRMLKLWVSASSMMRLRAGSLKAVHHLSGNCEACSAVDVGCENDSGRLRGESLMGGVKLQPLIRSAEARSSDFLAESKRRIAAEAMLFVSRVICCSSEYPGGGVAMSFNE